MTCKFCHTALPDHAVYCYHCGRKQQSSPRSRRRRPKTQGTITKLSGRRKPYWARLPAEYDGSSIVRKSLGCFATHAEAAEALGKAMYEPKSAKVSEITLQDIYDRFVESNYFENLSASGQASHRGAWKHLVPYADIHVVSINKEIFQKSVDAMKTKGLKRETIAKVRNLSSLLCKEAMGLGLISVNYGQLVQLPRSDSAAAQPFSSSELKALWQSSDSGNKTAMIVLILVYTGMRPGELLGIDINTHLHVDGPYWFFQTGSKTDAGKDRIIPIPPVIRPFISALINHREIGPLIPTTNGKHYRVDNWRSRFFNPLMELLGLQNHTPYSCRHTYADLQKRRHVPPEIMMEIMGHEDYATTVEKYQTTTEEDIALICAAADGLERPF